MTRPQPGWSRLAVSTAANSERGMSRLIAIGYADETTAMAADQEAHRPARDRSSSQTRSRDRAGQEGNCHMHTRRYAVGTAATFGMFWGFLFGLLFCIPSARSGHRRRDGRADGQAHQDEHRQAVPGPGPGHGPAVHLVPVLDDGEGGPGQGREGDEQVSRHGAEALAVQAGRAGTPGGPCTAVRRPTSSPMSLR
jgi:hypothetical protein